MSRKWILISFCALMVLSALTPLFIRNGREDVFPEGSGIREKGFSPRQRPAEEYNPVRAFNDAIADAVDKVMPSVVVIHTVNLESRIERDLFGFPISRYQQTVKGEGSGVIIDERGYVLTSLHLLQGAITDYIKIALNDGTTTPAKIVGYDTWTDLAVLEISSPGEPFPAVEFGDSDGVRVGEVAIAIGSPFSLHSSVTVGHVSQKGRRVEILPYEDFIQTDAAINEGNSGGPLVDADGRLIGINAAIQTDAEEKGVGIAFAVPSNLAMVIAKSIIDNGKHQWPWVGAFFGDEAGTFYDDGVPVEQVWRDTPAAEAGMLPGDIIIEVNGIRVQSEHDIYRIIFNHSVGESIRLTALRNNEKELVFDLRLEELPEQQ